MFQDDFPFPKVGYVLFPGGIGLLSLVQHVLVFQSSMGAKLLLPEQVAAISNQDTQQSAY